MDISQFWGKAQPRDETGPSWHPLICHCLDVAAVGEALLLQHSGLAARLSRWFDWPQEEVIRVVSFLICLHDIGKFAKKFQAKAAPERFPSCFPDNPHKLASTYDHGAGGLRLFDADADVYGMSSAPEAWRPLVSAVVGHHGAPSKPELDVGLSSLRPDFGKAGIEAACTFAKQVRELMEVPAELSPPNDQEVRPASFAVAGLAVLSDWIGSNQDWFPYRDQTENMEAYWEEVRPTAAEAVAQAGVLPAAAGTCLDYSRLVGPDATPTPMQSLVSEVEVPAGPCLFLIEDETGSGKTEAALMLAHRLMAAGKADGLYVALPTMATANAMFDRLADAHRQLFAQDAEPSIALAHGARDMHKGFQAARLRGGRPETPYPDSDQGTATASAACAEWVADDRRRTFLADIGAGTLDQALLSVLPSKHQSLRLLGLMQRALILDEVHAYDAYMQREIERLLEFQAGLGGSAILLSATLPNSLRESLTAAFARGLQAQPSQETTSGEYPLLTVCASGGQFSTAPTGQPKRGRSLPIRWLRSVEDALAEVHRAAQAEKAVLYIRNSVDDALDAYEELSNRNLDVDLFHARFALGDRLAIEKRVVETFGKKSRAEVRQGKVLIATQVVEQSLDLDFDVLITDLAPMDLVIQRAGRLWRHQRKERKGQLELLVVGPEPTNDADENWFADFFPRGAYVYRDHARLWLTARTLKEIGKIESPAGLRRLMEAVYGEDAETGLPSALQGIYWEAEGRAGAERGIAGTNLLDLSKGYVRDGGAWDKDTRTPTRLNDDPQVTLRLGLFKDGRIQPYAQIAAPDELWRAWRLSEVNITQRRIGGEAVPQSLTQAVHLARADWGSFEEDRILVVLNESTCGEGALFGAAMSSNATPKVVQLRYDPFRGLKVI